MATDYGNRLRTARNEAKMTQQQLSKTTGIPQSTISTAERDGRGSSETPTYAQACGVNALWLATGEGPKHPTTLPAIYQQTQQNALIPLAGRAVGAMDLEAAIDTVAAAMMQTDPVDRAAAKAYLIGLCDAPDRLDLRDKIRATLEPPPATQKPTPETGTKRAA